MGYVEADREVDVVRQTSDMHRDLETQSHVMFFPTQQLLSKRLVNALIRWTIQTSTRPLASLCVSDFNLRIVSFL